MKNKLTILSFLIFFGFSLNSSAEENRASIPTQDYSGHFQLSGDTARLSLEKGRSLEINGTKARLKDSSGQLIGSVDFSQKPLTSSVQEGSFLEERDLGSKKGNKKYLHGNKDPKGRRISDNSLKSKEKAEVEIKKWIAQKVAIQQKRQPNQAEEWCFDWGLTKEIFKLDSRKSLVEVSQEQKQGPFGYTRIQWADGSFERKLVNNNGQVRYVYDALEKTYRVIFLNAEEEKLAEWLCQKNCRQENTP